MTTICANCGAEWPGTLQGDRVMSCPLCPLGTSNRSKVVMASVARKRPEDLPLPENLALPLRERGFARIDIKETEVLAQKRAAEVQLKGYDVHVIPDGKMFAVFSRLAGMRRPALRVPIRKPPRKTRLEDFA